MRFTARIGQGIAVAAGALLLLWPAVLNGYPLLFPDSMSYIGDGRPLWRILLLHAPRTYTGGRSEFYSLGIFPFHWNHTAWPIVLLQALLTSYILWLTVRSLQQHGPHDPAYNLRRAVLQFFATAAFLSLTTSLAWYACFIMPDALGPVLYLAIYLLVFAHDTLSTPERCAVVTIAAWAAASHSTHLMLAAGLCILLAILFVLRFPPLLARARSIAGVAAILLAVAAAQMALHGYLYGRPSLFGNRLPYTMARFIADGPGRWYLQAHCNTLHWTICSRVSDLPDNDDDFLWTDGGIWQGATPQQQRQLLAEETPLVLATIRAYPGAQFRVSLDNFTNQLTEFGLWDFTPNDWMAGQIPIVLRGAVSIYPQTRQAQTRLPTVFFSAVEDWTVLASALAILVGLPLLWRRARWRLLGLASILVPVVIANAFLTAVTSEVDSRYQARVVWLIPLLAGLMLWDMFHQRRLPEELP